MIGLSIKKNIIIIICCPVLDVQMGDFLSLLSPWLLKLGTALLRTLITELIRFHRGVTSVSQTE